MEILKQSSGWVSPLFLFQASWVLPPYGGYYYYSGSSPIPPCRGRTFTVIMKKSIGISQQQFDILASIPTYEGYEPLNEMVPPVRELGDRQIYFNRKNLQYLLDDGVHLKSSERRKLKDAMKNAGEYVQFNYLQLLVISIIIILVGY